MCKTKGACIRGKRTSCVCKTKEGCVSGERGPLGCVRPKRGMYKGKEDLLGV